MRYLVLFFAFLISVQLSGQTKNLHQFTATTINGKTFDFATLKGKKVLIHSMESFGGEVIDKFEELPIITQEEVITSDLPFKEIMRLTNLSIPRLFLNTQDCRDFKEIFLNHKF